MRNPFEQRRNWSSIMPEMPINSVTGVITYRKCPRLFYHIYRTRGGTQQVPPRVLKGTIVHRVLQVLYESDYLAKDLHNKKLLAKQLLTILDQVIEDRQSDIEAYGLPEDEATDFVADCREVVAHVADRIAARNSDSMFDSFARHDLLTEQPVTDADLRLRGIIDAVEHTESGAIIIDYKLTDKIEITGDHKLQLALYSLLCTRMTADHVTKAGIWFLREDAHFMPVSTALLDHALDVAVHVRDATISDNIEDYPRGVGHLCKRMGPNCPCRCYED